MELLKAWKGQYHGQWHCPFRLAAFLVNELPFDIFKRQSRLVELLTATVNTQVHAFQLALL
jgi:hypothetical protein